MDNSPCIFACVTMWHETPDQMTKLLESLMRMDLEQCSQKAIQDILGIQNPNYYELEVHIVFDDAFFANNDGKMMINDFVRNLVASVDIAASKVYRKCENLESPTKSATPYGGCLVWRLPGENALVVHLKNTELVRNKKRWSQVMYMHYIMCYRLENRMKEKGLDNILRNTFLLTVDGDVFFEPNSVHLLVDLINSTRNKNTAAACARRYPVGRGALVNYQKLETITSFWMGKIALLMLGSSQGCPGAFSVIRAETLVESNIIEIFTTESREAMDLLQFDQGEDFWLSTLLLRKGYRLEYSPVSKWYDHAPETFAELYGQRRRWIACIWANMLDLLWNYREAIQCNANLSLTYFAYLVLLFAVFVLSPGYTFLTLIQAMEYTFPVSILQSLLANSVLIMFYILICFYTEIDTQITISKMFSVFYGFLTGSAILKRLTVDGISPFSVSHLVTSNIVIAILFHPRESPWLVYGVLHILGAPSIGMLVVLHAFINLHRISWGTREAQNKDLKQRIKADTHPQKIFTQRIHEEDSDIRTEQGGETEERNICSQIDYHSWLRDKVLEKSRTKLLQTEEEHFWKELIERYLHPTRRTSQEEAETSKKLLKLRNRVAFIILLLNSLFVLGVHQISLYGDGSEISQEKSDITRRNDFQIEVLHSILLVLHVLQILPTLIVVIQCVSMLLYRFRTLSDTLSTTIDKKCVDFDDFSFTKLAEWLQKKNMKDEEIVEMKYEQSAKCFTAGDVFHVVAHETYLPKQKEFKTLTYAFQKNLQGLFKKDLGFALNVRKQSFHHQNKLLESLSRIRSHLPNTSHHKKQK